MFRSLLVPLDGSPFAEQALPFALGIARAAGANLELVMNHVLYALQDVSAQWGPFDPLLEGQCKYKEQTYLDGTAGWLAATASVKVATALVNGVVPEGLLEYIQGRRPDLVVMTTHGRGPASRFFLGSVADQLIRQVPVPVLLVRPHDPPPGLIPSPLLTNVLIALDGSPLAEQVLEPARDLAAVMEAHCTLVRVIESHSAPALHFREAAESYLEAVARRFSERGLGVRTRVVVAPHAAAAILEEAKAQGSDLIALATHGRGGFRRMVLGSVADKVIRAAELPVLAYRPAAA